MVCLFMYLRRNRFYIISGIQAFPSGWWALKLHACIPVNICYKYRRWALPVSSNHLKIRTQLLCKEHAHLHTVQYFLHDNFQLLKKVANEFIFLSKNKEHTVFFECFVGSPFSSLYSKSCRIVRAFILSHQTNSPFTEEVEQ
jgi:hypothetical protein